MLAFLKAHKWKSGCVVLLLALTLPLLHPFPRQLIFGPKLHGEPWWVWESELRRMLHKHEHDQTLVAKVFSWVGLKSESFGVTDVMYTEEAIPFLIHLSIDGDERVRYAAVDALSYVRKPNNESARKALQARLQDGDPEVRLLAARSLWFGEWDRGVITAIRSSLDDPDVEIRRKAVLLARDVCSDAPDLLEPFGRRITDGDAGIRAELMHGMRHVDPKNAVPILMRGLDDENSHVRLAAVDSLRLHGPAARDAVKLLERRFLDDSMQDAVWHALHAIDRARYPAKDDAK